MCTLLSGVALPPTVLHFGYLVCSVWFLSFPDTAVLKKYWKWIVIYIQIVLCTLYTIQFVDFDEDANYSNIMGFERYDLP